MALALRDDQRGMSVVEFALVAPVMLLMLLGLGDLAYQGYMHSILVGAVQKAGRDSTIQGAGTDAIDQQVMASVLALNSTAQKVSSSRQNYANFSAAGPEAYDDLDNSGTYTPGDCFYDINGNGKWDSSPNGDDGQGGASDVTIYTIKIKYSHIFPMPSFTSWPQDVNLSSSTILKNQPFGPQGVRTTKQICS